MLTAIKYFFSLGKTYQDNLVSIERLNKILSIESESNGEMNLSEIKCIEVRNLCYSLPGKSKKLFENINAYFDKGNIYGIVGKNGKGKSTFLEILVGMRTDTKQGLVLYNDVPVEYLNMRQIRSERIGIMEQEPVVFNIGALNEFNRFKSSDAFGEKKEILNKYIEIFNLDDITIEKALGLNNEDNKTHKTVSVGEKQKITLIQVLLKDSNVLIFDEPTSALDIKSTECFITHLHSIKKEKIIFVVTHDNTLLNTFDEIIYF